MLTDQDIKKLTSAFATKDDLSGLATKEDFQDIRLDIKLVQKGLEEVREEVVDLKETVQGLEVSVDGLAKSVDDFRVDHAAVLGILDRHERWHKQVAEEVGVRLEG